MPSNNRITNIAIIGAGGNSGKYIASALQETNKFTLTAVTRPDSTSKIPDGIKTVKVDYDNHADLVSAFTGQDVLIITMNAQARDAQTKLIAAAGDANVPFVIPNEWGTDTKNADALLRDLPAFQGLPAAREQIKALPNTSYISVATGFWFEWSMSFSQGFGFDLNGRKVTFYDEGTQEISVSTWPQVGRAVAGLLSLPIQPENGDEKHSLEHFRDDVVLVNSFTMSQKKIFEAVLKATGTKTEDWEIDSQPVKERFEEGKKQFEQGNFLGFAQMLYARNFYPGTPMDFEHTRGTSNEILGLKTEDLQEWTEKTVELVKTWSAFSGRR